MGTHVRSVSCGLWASGGTKLVGFSANNTHFPSQERGKRSISVAVESSREAGMHT